MEQSSLLKPMAIAYSTLSEPDDLITRVELLVEGVVSKDDIPKEIVNKETIDYPADEVNAITNPAFDALRNIYASLDPSDRVEVLVYNRDNRLRHAFVDSVNGPDRRGYMVLSKVDQAYNHMCEQLDHYADQLEIPHLSQLERDVTEVIYDDIIVRRVLTGE